MFYKQWRIGKKSVTEKKLVKLEWKLLLLPDGILPQLKWICLIFSVLVPTLTIMDYAVFGHAVSSQKYVNTAVERRGVESVFVRPIRILSYLKVTYLSFFLKIFTNLDILKWFFIPIRMHIMPTNGRNIIKYQMMLPKHFSPNMTLKIYQWKLCMKWLQNEQDTIMQR